MALTLTVLSVLMLWAFLTVLVIGLLLILKSLEKIRGTLEQVTMGVRAIEWETKPLGRGVDAAATGLEETAGGLRDLAQRLADADRSLGVVAPALRSGKPLGG